MTCFTTGFVFSQTEAELRNNPEVIWLGETIIRFNPDMGREELKKQGITGHALTLKIQALPSGGKELFWDENQNLNTKFCSHEYLTSEKHYLYYDSLLSKPIGTAERQKIGSSIDTVVYYNPETFEEYKQVLVNALDPLEIKSYRLRVLCYYHHKEMIYRALPLAIAPIGKNGLPLFWTAVAQTNKTDLNNPDFNWVKRVAYNFPLEADKINTLKKSEKDCVVDIFVPDVKKANAPLYDCTTFLGSAPLSNIEVQTIGNSTDTVITFDPKSFTEIVNVVKNKLNPGDVKEIRIIQDWIWDHKKQQLLIRPMGFSPIINRYDEKGNFLYSGPMFYRREIGVE